MVQGWAAQWVGEGCEGSGWAGYALQTAGNAGSKLLIFVLRIRWKDHPAETPVSGVCFTKFG